MINIREWLCGAVFGGHQILYVKYLGINKGMSEFSMECERCNRVSIIDRDEYERMFHQ